MEYRNPYYSTETTIDCEINHPKYGWIPFTAVREDTGAEFDVEALYDALVADPNTVPYLHVAPLEALSDVAAEEMIAETFNKSADKLDMLEVALQDALKRIEALETGNKA
jgi:uncharacterized protein YfaA (DUF2138 family)